MTTIPVLEVADTTIKTSTHQTYMATNEVDCEPRSNINALAGNCLQLPAIAYI